MWGIYAETEFTFISEGRQLSSGTYKLNIGSIMYRMRIVSVRNEIMRTVCFIRYIIGNLYIYSFYPKNYKKHMTYRSCIW
jgi:hypothetical protein